MLVYWLDIVGTAVFAISGVLLAGKLRMDPFGVLVLGVVTAVGGGTIRDMALDHGPVGPRNPHDFTYRNLRNCLYYRRYCPRYGLLHIFRTTGNSQYDGHGRDAIDSAGGYSLAS